MEMLVFLFWLALVIGAIYGANRVRKIGYEKYDLKLIWSWTFPALVFGFPMTIVGWFVGLVATFSTTVVTSPSNFIVAGIVGLVLTVLAIRYNISRSSKKFGFLFSLVQILCGLTVVVAIYLIFAVRAKNVGMGAVKDDIGID